MREQSTLKVKRIGAGYYDVITNDGHWDARTFHIDSYAPEDGGKSYWRTTERVSVNGQYEYEELGGPATKRAAIELIDYYVNG